MDAENFFSRWSRRKAQAMQARHADAAEETLPTDHASEQETPAPTMEDVAALTPDSDFSRFLVRGVDADVRRSAMKKLFSDPHFNAMDGLDIYIDDYNKFQPMPAAMLAALNHAQGVLNPKPLFETPPERLLDDAGENRDGGEGGDGGEKREEIAGVDSHDEPEEEKSAAALSSEEVRTEEVRTATDKVEHKEDTEDGPDHADQIPRM